MINVHPQYVIDDNKQYKAVLLSFEEWKKVLEELEELEDIRAYDQAKAGPQDRISLEQAVREIEEGYNT